MTETYVGRNRLPRVSTSYELFCDEQRIPIYRGMWNFETGRVWAAAARVSISTAAVENTVYTSSRCRPANHSNRSNHLYEEIIFVVEGRKRQDLFASAEHLAPHRSGVSDCSAAARHK